MSKQAMEHLQQRNPSPSWFSMHSSPSEPTRMVGSISTMEAMDLLRREPGHKQETVGNPMFGRYQQQAAPLRLGHSPYRQVFIMSLRTGERRTMAQPTPNSMLRARRCRWIRASRQMISIPLGSTGNALRTSHRLEPRSILHSVGWPDRWET